MSDIPSRWTVIDRESAVLTLEYEFAKGARATTFAARMGNGQLLVISPCVGLSDVLHCDLLSYGDVGAIVANNGFHYLGQREWRSRFPAARCFAPVDAIRRIAKKAPDGAAFEPLSALTQVAGPNIGFREVADTKIGESWFWINTGTGYIWYVSDVLINLVTLPNAFVPRLLFRLSRSAPGFRVFNLMLMMSVKDKAATLRQLRVDMAHHEPTVIVPAHGATLSQPTTCSDARALIEKAL